MPPRRQESPGLWTQLGYRELQDLLWHFPRRYEDRRNSVDPFQAPLGEPLVVRGRIESARLSRWRGGRACLEVRMIPQGRIDDLTLVWYNMPFLKTHMKEGKELFVYGKLSEHKNGIRMVHPEHELIRSGEDEQIHLNRITPIYRLSGSVRQKQLRREIYRLLDQEDWACPEVYPVPDGLVELRAALASIHFPASWENYRSARRRLVFDELLFMQLALGLRRQAVRALAKERSESCLDLVGPFLEKLPFAPTGAQKRVMEELDEDLKRPYPMNRLLQGDVGSGKTLVAAYALLRTMEAGNNGALMAPTETLAVQHYHHLKERFEGLDVDVLLMTATRKDEMPSLFGGRPCLFVGTHALFQEGADLGRLGLGVVDEQHKFGVGQRQRFLRKGEHPDLLVMTATPIPRTLCLTQYGDLDVSILDELPPGRDPVRTVIRSRNQLSKVWDYIEGEMQDGRQAYVVFPLLEESESQDMKSAKEGFRELQERFGADRVVMLHGQMKPEEKAAAMEAFSEGRCRVMVATSVIEVGVDVPQATMMVVEHAERFGLAQLHQLRGRVGRGKDKSYCVLVGNPKNPEASERLAVMERTQDGFEIAEEDFRLRGPGDIAGTRQSGSWGRLLLADPVRDHELLMEARRYAGRLLDQDPGLRSNPGLRERLDQLGMESGSEAAN